MVTLSYSDGTDVFVHNETEVETAMAETDVISVNFRDLIATPGLHVSYTIRRERKHPGASFAKMTSSKTMTASGDTFGAYLNGHYLSDNFYDVEYD